jgi:hypothetical protein
VFLLLHSCSCTCRAHSLQQHHSPSDDFCALEPNRQDTGNQYVAAVVHDMYSLLGFQQLRIAAAMKFVFTRHLKRGLHEARAALALIDAGEVDSLVLSPFTVRYSPAALISASRSLLL